MSRPIFAVAQAHPLCRILHRLIAVVLMAAVSPVAASEWRYGCRGVLPSGDAPIIIFSRSSLVMVPNAWAKGSLFAAVNDDLLSSHFRAADDNSGLATKMVFTRAQHPDEKLTLTETSSRTVSDVHERAGRQPRTVQITTYRKVYRWVSDGGYQGPYDIKMDCINYELSAPLR